MGDFGDDGIEPAEWGDGSFWGRGPRGITKGGGTDIWRVVEVDGMGSWLK